MALLSDHSTWGTPGSSSTPKRHAWQQRTSGSSSLTFLRTIPRTMARSSLQNGRPSCLKSLTTKHLTILSQHSTLAIHFDTADNWATNLLSRPGLQKSKASVYIQVPRKHKLSSMLIRSQPLKWLPKSHRSKRKRNRICLKLVLRWRPFVRHWWTLLRANYMETIFGLEVSNQVKMTLMILLR